MTTMLRDVVNFGTATRALSLGRKDLAGKTGTTNENVDAWFCGFNASIVGVSWIGFDQPRTLGTNETGGVAALPIWISFMQKALKGVPEKPLPPPDGVIACASIPTPACATTAAASSEYFFAEFPPRVAAATACAAPVPGRTTPDVRDQLFWTRACRRGSDEPVPASGSPAASARRTRTDRVRIAQAAARLIAEHGITDWSLAKRKAARQLMLPEREALPGDDEIEAALTEHHALFARDTHARQLRGQREEALRWMRRLAQFAAAPDGRRGGRMGDRAQRHPPRARRARTRRSVELALLNAGRAVSCDGLRSRRRRRSCFSRKPACG